MIMDVARDWQSSSFADKSFRSDESDKTSSTCQQQQVISVPELVLLMLQNLIYFVVISDENVLNES